MPSPRENSALWDYVVLGTVTLPPEGVNGRVTVDAPIEWDNDKKQQKGSNISRTTKRNRKSAGVTIEIEFEDAPTVSGGESQYDLVVAALDEIKLSAGPYEIAHGATDFSQVRGMTIDKITGPKWGNGKGTITISGKAWDPPKQGLGGVGGGVNGVLSPEKLKLLSELEAYLQQLNNQIAADPQSPFVPTLQVEQQAVIAKIAEIKASAVQTPEKAKPAKDYYQAGKNSQPTVPLGETQP